MSESDIVSAVVDYYEAKLAAFGATARGVDWKDEASQNERFRQLVRALGVPPHGEPFTIVDYGCGWGALVPFLAARPFRFVYTGYDRSTEMIAEARRMHDGTNFTSDWGSVEPADYVIASGVFNVRLDTPEPEWRDYVFHTLATINEKATVGWAANFLTSYADEDRKRRDLYYADPAMVFDWCRRKGSRWVSLLHDYDLHEFTIGVSRSPR